MTTTRAAEDREHWSDADTEHRTCQLAMEARRSVSVRFVRTLPKRSRGSCRGRSAVPPAVRHALFQQGPGEVPVDFAEILFTPRRGIILVAFNVRAVVNHSPGVGLVTISAGAGQVHPQLPPARDR